MSDSADKYAVAKADRQSFVDKVLNSQSRKKIVVAGPGTGKTTLFKDVLKGKRNSLTLTFVNSLVEDLTLELNGLSKVRTLHAFARDVIRRANGSARVFPNLSSIIKDDASVLEGKTIDFDELFYNRDDNNENIPFYKKRKDYYGHYGFCDIIFAAARYLEVHPEKIPAFDQVVVDEFQDFNMLEVSLIDLLAKTSPILLAGDDDQALYYFKKASPIHIRQRFSDGHPEYDAFTLPYCSRCTRVIVDAFNDVVRFAIRSGFLQDRIEKSYIFYDDKDKDADCGKYPTLVHAQGCFPTQISFFIAKQISELAEERRQRFSVLVIAPTKRRCRRLAKSLRKKGFKNVTFVESEGSKEPQLLDGLKILIEDKKSNLGWRIVLKFLMSESELRPLL